MSIDLSCSRDRLPPSSASTTMSGIALKLTSLLVRTVAKPVANVIKAQAKEHEFFRQTCIRIAQTAHLTDLRLRMSLLGEKRIKIRPLNDKKAIENGANFMSEFFIFLVAGSLILYETYRSRKKASDEKDQLADDISTLQSEIIFIKEKLESMDVRFDDWVPPEGIHPKYVDLSKLREKRLSKEAAQSAPSGLKDVPNGPAAVQIPAVPKGAASVPCEATSLPK